jgi:hypothetical protein
MATPWAICFPAGIIAHFAPRKSPQIYLTGGQRTQVPWLEFCALHHKAKSMCATGTVRVAWWWSPLAVTIRLPGFALQWTHEDNALFRRRR